MLNNHGPLYVIALYPQDVIDKHDEDEYTPWFVAHVTECELTGRVINKFFDEFEKSEDNTGCEVMENFATFLEEKGYIVLNSAGSDGAGRVVIDRDRIEDHYGEFEDLLDEEDEDDDDEDEQDSEEEEAQGQGG